MKRFLTIAVTAILLVFPQAPWAITAKSSSSQTAQKESERRDTTAQPVQSAEPQQESAPDSDKAREMAVPTAKPKSGGSLLDKLRREVLQSKKETKPSYDQFRDANNDGVADKVTSKRESGSEDASGEAVQTSTQKAAAPAPVEVKAKPDSDSGAKSSETPKSAGRKKPK